MQSAPLDIPRWAPDGAQESPKKRILTPGAPPYPPLKLIFPTFVYDFKGGPLIFTGGSRGVTLKS